MSGRQDGAARQEPSSGFVRFESGQAEARPASGEGSGPCDSLAPPPSFREVYDRYFDFVWRTAGNRGVPDAAIDDVVQEVFIVVHRKLHQFEGRSALKTWLTTIIRRVIADYVRKRGNQPAGHAQLEQEPRVNAGPAEELERKAAVALLDSLMARMTDDQREAFILHDIEHMSGAEIAGLTGVNENTVWSRLRSARRIFEQGVARERVRSRREQT